MFTNACVFSLCSIFFYTSTQEERSPELLTPSGRKRTSARTGRQFLDEMAVVEGSGEEEEKEQEQQEGFIVPDDQGEPGPSPSYYSRRK